MMCSLDSFFEESPSEVDVEGEVWELERREQTEEIISRLSPESRNLYQGVMLHDGNGRNSHNGTLFRERVGVSQQTVSAMRSVIRKKLRVIH